MAFIPNTHICCLKKGFDMPGSKASKAGQGSRKTDDHRNDARNDACRDMTGYFRRRDEGPSLVRVIQMGVNRFHPETVIHDCAKTLKVALNPHSSIRASRVA